MPRIFDFGGREVERSQTVAGLRALKVRQAAQVTAEMAEESAAAEAASVEMVVCRAANVVREGSRCVFVTAALGFAEAVTPDEILRAAFPGAISLTRTPSVAHSAPAIITGGGMARQFAAKAVQPAPSNVWLGLRSQKARCDVKRPFVSPRGYRQDGPQRLGPLRYVAPHRVETNKPLIGSPEQRLSGIE